MGVPLDPCMSRGISAGLSLPRGSITPELGPHPHTHSLHLHAGVCKSLEQDAARSGFAPHPESLGAPRSWTPRSWASVSPQGRGPGTPPATPIPPSPSPGRLGYSPGISPPWSSHPPGPRELQVLGRGAVVLELELCTSPGPESSRSPWGPRPAAPRAPAARPGLVRPRALPGRPGRDCSCVRNGALSRAGEKGWLPHSGPASFGPSAGPNM